MQSRMKQPRSFDPLGMSLFVAAGIHTLFILGIGFSVDKPVKTPPPDRTLEIMVVHNPKKEKIQEKADFLAQASQEGGGTTEEKIKPKTQLVPPTTKPKPKATRESPPAKPTPPPVKKPPKKVVTTKAPAKRKVDPKPAPKPQPKQKQRPITAAQILASTNREIARLSAELDRKTKAYAKRPRRKTISASTQEYRYANYMDAWRKKVERVGNLNYPDAAKRQRLYGSLVLHVAIRNDGTVKKVRILKSSGHKLLDDAAVRIVRLSAPFAPFPKEIRKEVDLLDIVRTWQFQSNNRLFSK
ncbi:MAG: energy transducer TonB [Gammaproteobacteria bacterium]|nr:energy transducer TonB [Gammaproteobacteria bacterium]